ncbi:ERAD-associated E3 ubiquitin-protein ligase hrd1 [Lasiodiplodia hormozganensis]|uniref:ERAD-associated E3 ubiquitin-protein ligase hrd1 n=1 Tax=Lasiodiplodia hormozganensis TaxID=869390 RepID=A0AA39TPU8_9PEZI|nr:ERAD-associated E3 ubiquitin-protein ligase hrd1 [Lasiodiplodia hormozganensis]
MFRLFGFRRSESDNSSSQTPNPSAISPVSDRDTANFSALVDNSLPVRSSPTTPPPMLVNAQDSQPVRPPSTPPPQLVNVPDSRPVSSPPLRRAETPTPLPVRVPEPPNASIFPSDDYFANWMAQHTARGDGAAAAAALGTLAAASDASRRRRRRQERLGGGRTNQHGDLAFSQSVEQTAEAFQRIAITMEQQLEAAVAVATAAAAAAAAASNARREESETRPRHHYRSHHRSLDSSALYLPSTSGAAEASRGVTRQREEDPRDFSRQLEEEDEANARVEGGQERQQDSRGGQQPAAAGARAAEAVERARSRRRRFGHVVGGNGITAVDKAELQEKGSVGCDICYERWHWAAPEDGERVAPGKATMFGKNGEATGEEGEEGEEEEDEAAAAAAVDRVCQEPRKLPCGHIFGKECLTDWLARKDTCPACRRKVATGSASSPYTTGLEMLRVIYNDKNKKNKKEWERALQIFRGSPAFLDEGFTY